MIMNKRLLKRESNIRDDEKNSLSSRKVQTITNTNMVTNGRIRNKLVTGKNVLKSNCIKFVTNM